MRNLGNPPSGDVEYESIDWIYWVDIDKPNKALVFNDRAGYTSSHLRHYFQSVDSLPIENAYQFKKALHDKRIKRNSYDLIFCTHLYHEVSANATEAALVIETLYSALSIKGNLVVGYIHGPTVFGAILNKLINGNLRQDRSQRSKIKGSRARCRKFMEIMLKDKRFRLISTLFVHPTIGNPWTISDSRLMFKKVSDWKKKTARNSILLSIMSSEFGSCLAWYCWPNRILIMGK